jgi:hypothetical protein
MYNPNYAAPSEVYVQIRLNLPSEDCGMYIVSLFITLVAECTMSYSLDIIF